MILYNSLLISVPIHFYDLCIIHRKNLLSKVLLYNYSYFIMKGYKSKKFHPVFYRIEFYENIFLSVCLTGNRSNRASVFSLIYFSRFFKVLFCSGVNSCIFCTYPLAVTFTIACSLYLFVYIMLSSQIAENIFSEKLFGNIIVVSIDL